MEDYTVDLGDDNNSLSETWKHDPDRMSELTDLVSLKMTEITKGDTTFPEVVKYVTSQARNPLELYTVSQYLSVALMKGIEIGLFDQE